MIRSTDTVKFSLSTRISLRRNALGLTQRQLAIAIGETPAQISRYENERHMPRARQLANLASALECSADYLLGISNTTRRAR